ALPIWKPPGISRVSAALQNGRQGSRRAGGTHSSRCPTGGGTGDTESALCAMSLDEGEACATLRMNKRSTQRVYWVNRGSHETSNNCLSVSAGPVRGYLACP